MPETPRRASNQRHAFLLAACLLMACLPAPRASAHGRAAAPPSPQAGGQEEEERPLRRPGGLKRFGTNVLDFLKCKKANVRKRQELLEYGPQFPKRYHTGDFSFQAIVGANWPVAVEYELEQQGTAVVRIEVMDNLPFTQTLKGGGLGERRTARFTLPAYKGEGPHPALISLKATLDGYPEEPARFRLLGMAAGDDAVAAVPGNPPLEVAALGPLPYGVVGYAPAPQRCACASKLCNVQFNAAAGGGYAYSFCVATAKFHRWAVDIMRHVPVKNTDDYERIGRVKNVARRIGPDQTINEAWDGRKPVNGRNIRSRKVRPGMYSVFVMVWWSGSSVGPWAFADPSKFIPIR